MLAASGLARDRSVSSVVVVGVKTDPDAYCCGCVVVQSKTIPQSGNKTLVITSAEFVQGRENDLTVVFWDKAELKATVLRTEGAFSLLSTDVHDTCQAIDLLLGDAGLDNSRTFTRVPLSHTTTRFTFTYITSNSLESYSVGTPNLVPNSANYFMASCNYFRKTSSGVNRLTGAPVFCNGDASIVGRTIGIVLQDCRHDPGCSGAEFKVVLAANHLQEVITNLVDPPQKNRGKKRKKSKP